MQIHSLDYYISYIKTHYSSSSKPKIVFYPLPISMYSYIPISAALGEWVYYKMKK